MTALVTLKTIEAPHRRDDLDAVLNSLRPAGRACLQAMSHRNDEIGALVRRQLRETIGLPDPMS